MILNESINIDLDCIGQKCPGPVLRIAREVAALGPHGGFLSIRADDPAFHSDIEAWARGTSAQILNLDREPHGVIRAWIAVGDARFIEPPREPPSDTVTLDSRGADPRGLILELAKAVDAGATGSLVRMISDHPNFTMDLTRWLRGAGAELVNIESMGETRVCVRVTKPAAAEPAARPLTVPASAVPRSVASPAEELAPREHCTLLVLHNDHEALLAALLVANGAAAQGMSTSVFFTFWGLNLLRGASPNPAQPREKVGFMRRLMKWMMRRGPEHQRLGQMHFAGAGKLMLSSIMRSENILGLSDLMDNAQELGVEFTACTMSMSVMGITRRDLHPYPNLGFAGVASFVERAQRSSISLVF